VCVLSRKIEYADRLVADQISFFGIAHIAVGYHPDLFSVHNNNPFRIAAIAAFSALSISFLQVSVKTKGKIIPKTAYYFVKDIAAV